MWGTVGSPEIWEQGDAGVGNSSCQGCLSEGAGKGWVTEGHRVAEEAEERQAGFWEWVM